MSSDVITVNGTSFQRNGESVTYAGQDAFSLFGRWVRAEPTQPTLDDYQAVLEESLLDPAVRFLNVIRIFFMVNSFDQIWPQDIPGFYRGVREFCVWLGTSGWIVDAEVFADAQIIMPDRAQQVEHFVQFCQAVAGLQNVLVSLGNESPKNGFNPVHFLQPVGVISSKGSNLSDDPPPVPGWTYSKFHGRRDGLKGLLASTDMAFAVAGFAGEQGHGYVGTHQATIHDEPIGAADIEIPGRRTNRPEHFYKLGADAALWGAGGTFHSECGIKAIPYTDQQRLCAKAFFMGMSKIDPNQRFVA